MPTGNLPDAGKRIFEAVFEKSNGPDCDEKCAAQRAWGAVENAGWHQVDGEWKKNAELSEFSFTIKKASLDPETGIRRWRADTSDIEVDSYGDKMSLSLYEDFLEKIEKTEAPPKEFSSEFWSGGLPYLSLSHYPDANGSAVPGMTEALFIDGKFLKAKGTFDETPLGIACWEAIKSDFKNDPENKVRISIAFLDYQHKHLSEVSKGFLFERKELDDICPICLSEMITGNFGGKEFLKGHLIHLALTRVPVNKRTLMEVDRSMTTQKEDAESIVGEELAGKIEEEVKELSTNKAALTIKGEADGEDTVQTFEVDIPGLDELRSDLRELITLLAKKDKKEMDDEEEEDEDEKKKKKEKKEKSEVVEEIVDPNAALADAVLTGMSQLSEALGVKMDILIAQSQQTANVQVPQRRGILDAPAPQQIPTGQPLTVLQAIQRQSGIS